MIVPSEEKKNLRMMVSWFVYMIRCSDGSLYTGCTNHVIRRWHQHLDGKGARYLKAHTPEKLVYTEELPDRSEACRREYEIKQFSKEEKEALVGSLQIRN